MKSFNSEIRHETHQILERSASSERETLQEHEIQNLPVPVQQWLAASGAVGREKARNVWLKQTFKIKLKPQQKKWYHAHAQQLFVTREPSFIWAVRLKMLPLLTVVGRDKFFNGQGEMQMKLNGIFNLSKDVGPKMDEGTLQRYLGEITWFPSAAVSPYITWEAIDDDTARATMNYKGTSGSGTFYFNKYGLLDKFVALRYMGNVQHAKRYNWIITAKEHAQWGNFTVPTKLEATWQLESGPWTWCAIEVTDIKYNIEDKSLNLI